MRSKLWGVGGSFRSTVHEKGTRDPRAHEAPGNVGVNAPPKQISVLPGKGCEAGAARPGHGPPPLRETPGPRDVRSTATNPAGRPKPDTARAPRGDPMEPSDSYDPWDPPNGRIPGGESRTRTNSNRPPGPPASQNGRFPPISRADRTGDRSPPDPPGELFEQRGAGRRPGIDEGGFPALRETGSRLRGIGNGTGPV